MISIILSYILRKKKDNRVIRTREARKERQYNGQKKMENMTNNEVQNTSIILAVFVFSAYCQILNEHQTKTTTKYRRYTVYN